MVGSIEEVRRASRAQGPATIMAVGTANPPHSYDQSTFPDYYFRVTNSEHMTQLKDKMRRIYILKRTPKMTEYEGLSLNSRQEMLVTEVPKLGKEAAAKAIEEWGQPKSKITHLVFCTSSTFDMPGADYQLLNLLDLSPWVQRFMLYNTGCYGTGSGLRLAKDLAENNKDARVLVVWVDLTVSFFHGPSDTSHDILVSMSIFGDGAAACVVGSDLIPGGVEKPVFEIFSASQTLIPGSGYAITIPLQESGLTVHMHKDLPGLVSKNIEKILVEAFKPLGISDWNSLFWLVHPGGRAILDKLELELDLEPKKLRASRHILREYGNMAGACAMFVLDEMRNKSVEENLKTNGEGLEWGVLLAFGPGVTVETLVLHSVPR